MARHCVRWASGKKRSKTGMRSRFARHGRHCRFGVVKRGRRKGACLKHKRSKKRKPAYAKSRYIFHNA